MPTGVRARFTSDVHTEKILVNEAVANLSEKTDQPHSCAPRKP